tara:strand:+ start:701 stop:1009 length:309 start_codon:yes stop_codon:yes gene_type:complete
LTGIFNNLIKRTAPKTTRNRKMETKKALKVNLHNGTMQAGIAKGEKAIIIDYTLDGKKWINHGIYCRNLITDGRVEKIKQSLLNVGVLSSREDQIFPVDCRY